MSLPRQSLPHLPLATTDLFAGPLVSRHSFETHFTYNLLLLVFAPNANLPAPSQHAILPQGQILPSVGETERENSGQERGQEPVSVIALQLRASCLESLFSSPDKFLCFGDAEGVNTGGDGTQVVQGEECA